MKTMVERILAQYGSPVTILRDGAQTAQVRAFVEPVSEKNWRGARAVMELGEVPLGRYVYVGPPEAALRDGDRVQCGGRDYMTVHVEDLLLAGQPVYVWALLRERGGDEPWNS